MAIETKQLHALSKVYLEAVYGGVKKEAPKTYEMWHYYMDAKPEVARIWEKIQDDLVAGSNVRNANVYTSILDMFRNTEAKMRERIEKDYSPS